MKRTKRLLNTTNTKYCSVKNMTSNHYVVYSSLFLLVGFLCYFRFIRAGISLVDNYDAWDQHYRALAYYSQYLKGIAKELFFNHKIVIPDWNFSIGEGGDILATLHYYVIGDPIAFLCVFVPQRFIHIFYSFSCILRIYLSGIAFVVFCRYKGLRSLYGVTVGALSYAFCYWAIYCSARHPYFLNPLIYFPLILFGVEKIINKEKPYFFIIMTAISALSNIYFFYMLVILTILYVIVRLLIQRYSLKEWCSILLKFLLFSCIGVCIAGVILLPVVYTYIADARVSLSTPLRIFYPLYYYSQLPAAIISNNTEFWLRIGITSPAFLAVLMVFLKRHRNITLIVLFLVSCLLILTPIGGTFLNGMTYITNRWVWAYAFLISYMFSSKWDEMIVLSNDEFIPFTIFISILFFLCLLFPMSRNIAAFSAIPLMLIFIIVSYQNASQILNCRVAEYVCLMLVIIGICNLAFWHFSSYGDYYIAQCKSNDDIEADWNNNESTIIESISEQSNTRYSGRNLTSNVNLLKDISATQYYWSTSNPYVNDFRTDLEFIELPIHCYEGYDDRAAPLALSSVEYYSIDKTDKKSIPYGFELIGTYNSRDFINRAENSYYKKIDEADIPKDQKKKILKRHNKNYNIYRNTNSLPFGYCYDKFISAEVVDSLDPVQRQEVELEAACIESKDKNKMIFDNIVEYTDYNKEYSVPYRMIPKSKHITASGNSFTVTSHNSTVVLQPAQKIENAEIYVRFEGLKYIYNTKYDLYFGNESADPLNLYSEAYFNSRSLSKKEDILRDQRYHSYLDGARVTVKSSSTNAKDFFCAQPGMSTYYGKNNVIVNLGYMENSPKKIYVTFGGVGTYTYDGIYIYSIPMEGFKGSIDRLKEDCLENVSFTTDTISGNIELKKDKILCLPIPFSKGWHGYIDGSSNELICVNSHYIGLVVPKGSHGICLQYSRPMKVEGFIVSMIGVITFICSFIALTVFRLDSKDLND